MHLIYSPPQHIFHLPIHKNNVKVISKKKWNEFLEETVKVGSEADITVFTALNVPNFKNVSLGKV